MKIEPLNTEEIVKNLLGNDVIDFKGEEVTVYNSDPLVDFRCIIRKDENFTLRIYNDHIHWDCEVVESGGIENEVERGILECPKIQSEDYLTHEYYYILDWGSGAEERYRK